MHLSKAATPACFACHSITIALIRELFERDCSAHRVARKPGQVLPGCVERGHSPEEGRGRAAGERRLDAVHAVARRAAGAHHGVVVCRGVTPAGAAASLPVSVALIHITCDCMDITSVIEVAALSSF